MKPILLAGIAAALPLLATSALASPCGDKSAAMLRRYQATAASNVSPQGGTGGIASADSTRPGAVPITTTQRLKIAHLVVKANSEAQAGNESGCNADVGAAEAVIHSGA